MSKRILLGASKCLLSSAVIITIVVVFALIYAFATAAPLPLDHIFRANFIIGGIIVCLGIFSVPYSPISTQGALKYFRHARHPQGPEPDFHVSKTHAAHKTNGNIKNAAVFLFTGISIIAFTVLGQFIIL